VFIGHRLRVDFLIPLFRAVGAYLGGNYTLHNRLSITVYLRSIDPLDEGGRRFIPAHIIHITYTRHYYRARDTERAGTPLRFTTLQYRLHYIYGGDWGWFMESRVRRTGVISFSFEPRQRAGTNLMSLSDSLRSCWSFYLHLLRDAFVLPVGC